MSHAVVTVGGGTGSPIINEALLRTNKVNTILAVAAVYDSGGATGKKRLDSYGKEIAYSDPMRILLSLVTPNEYHTKKYQALKGWFNHRDDTDKVLGHDIFNRRFSRKNGFSKLEEDITDLGITLHGHVLPSSTDPSNIAFVTKSGRHYRGEHLLDDNRMSKDMVIGMELSPAVNAYQPAMNAIEKAKLIILSCGSIHGSVLSNFLPKGMKEAFAKSRAKIYLVTNLVSTRNETHNFKPLNFVKIIEQYTGKKPHGLIVPHITRMQFERQHPKTAQLYKLDHSGFLGWEAADLKAAEKTGIEIIQHDATVVVEGKGGYQVVRHDPKKLSLTLGQILH